MEKEIPEIFSDAITVIRQKAEKAMSEMGIPVLVGEVEGGGCCFVTIKDFEFKSYKKILTDGSICVINVDEADAEEGQKPLFVAIQINIRMGLTSTWIRSVFDTRYSNDDEEDEDEGYLDDLEPELDSETLTALGVKIARIPSFSALKNKTQRFELTRSVVEKSESLQLEDFTLREIADRAENFFTLGVLPLKAKELHSSGKSLSEIANSLGISKQKAERAISAEIPDFIAGILNRST